MPVEAIFPTPIYYSVVDNLDNISREIDAALSKTNFSYKPEWGTTHHMSDPSFSQNFIVDNNLTTFQDTLQQHMQQYFNEMGCPKQCTYKIKSSWSSLFKPRDFGHVHAHGYNDISGVYYHKTNNHDGDIFFLSPNTHLATSYCYEHTHWVWEHKPLQGKLLLFPSWLQHGIKTNETEDERISISFNIVVER